MLNERDLLTWKSDAKKMTFEPVGKARGAQLVDCIQAVAKKFLFHGNCDMG